ncbi:MAG: inorganic phosphate transporter [Planctomycetota bacterium]|nr:inorganic phosphate transporter [Planctomycetota bacterium]
MIDALTTYFAVSGMELFLLSSILVIGLYAAWNIGANDVANAMGTSVGSGALTMKQAVILAGIFEFLGAVIVGSSVSETVRKKMFDPAQLTVIYGDKAAYVLACGMIASLLAAGTWLLIATWKSWPVSTTHSIVGAVVGFGCVALGVELIEWSKVGLITAGWVMSPVISGAIAYAMFSLILKSIFFKRDPVRAATQLAPWLVFMVLIVLCGVTAYKGLAPMWSKYKIDPFEPKAVAMTITVALVIGVIGFFVAKILLRNYVVEKSSGVNPMLHADVARSLGKAMMHLKRVRANTDGNLNDESAKLLKQLEAMHTQAVDNTTFGTDSEELKRVEKIFVYLQILTACFVAFAHGANDVANAIGPMSAGWQAVRTGAVELKAPVPFWALALGGVGIIFGLATWGWRVIQTVGKRITELTPSRGFCAEFAAAVTILLASVLPFALPVSTTHTLVGAVLGVGAARGIGALNLRTMRDIFASWAITIPAGAMLSVVFFYLLKLIVFGNVDITVVETIIQ